MFFTGEGMANVQKIVIAEDAGTSWPIATTARRAARYNDVAEEAKVAWSRRGNPPQPLLPIAATASDHAIGAPFDAENFTQAGVGTYVTWPVGTRRPSSGPIRKVTMESLS